jgi:hypothetical protein
MKNGNTCFRYLKKKWKAEGLNLARELKQLLYRRHFYAFLVDKVRRGPQNKHCTYHGPPQERDRA